MEHLLKFSETEKRAQGVIKSFFKETFRAHSKEEYKEFFARSGEGAYRTYPFIWIRALALELIVFAIALIVSGFTGYDTFWSYSVFIGGILLNIPVFILAYELYPSRDFGFLRYFIAFAVGGVVAIALALLAYYVYEPSNEWLSALWVGFVEEFFKAVPAIVFIIAYRKKSPLFGFLIGAAVGAGVSVIEDMFYIHNSAGAWGFWGNSWQTLIETSVGRALTAGCTHALWTALIGWAFCKFKKPFINFRFYLVAILSIALHFAWDLPLEDWWASGLVYIGCAVVGLVFAVVLLKKERAAVFGGVKAIEPEQQVLEEVAAAEAVEVKSCAFGLGHIANLVAVLCLCVVAAFTVGVCFSNWGFVSYQNVYFESIAELYDYLQDGLPINAEEILSREYDYNVDFDSNYAYAYEDGKWVSATQTATEIKDGYNFEYYYEYNFKYDEEKKEYEAKIDYVKLYIDGVRYYQCTYYTNDKLIFFSKDAPTVWYDDDRGQYYVDESCDEYFDGVVGASVCGAVMGLTLIGGITAFTVLKIKARREKND